jgi:hypothetical protein
MGLTFQSSGTLRTGIVYRTSRFLLALHIGIRYELGVRACGQGFYLRLKSRYKDAGKDSCALFGKD